jgi:hypothetical protein
VRYLPLFLALSAPFITLFLFPGRIFAIDFESFGYWAKCLSRFQGPAYSDCSPQLINYPTVGLYASAGVIQLLQSLGLQGASVQFGFQLFLGAVDTLSVLLMYLLLRGLGISHAAWATLVFAVLPSTRMGGNLWGQIDDVTQLFLSAALLFGLRCLRAAHRATATKALRYFLALSFAIACSLLTKQLAVFSLPALGIMWIVCVSRLYRLIPPAALSGTIVAVAVVFIVVDQLFPTPPGYYGSGLLYVFMRGSDHASTVQAMGTSLFALLPIPGHEPSTWAYPIFTLGGVTAKVIPLYFGQFAFFTTVFVMTFFGALVVKRLRPLNPEQVLLMTLAVAAGANLFMNTFLAGTHERYLYHYGFFVYPLLLSLVRTSSFSKALFALCLMHLCIYGCFVFKVFIFDLESPLTKYAQQTVALANVVSSFVALWLVTQAARRRASKVLA